MMYSNNYGVPSNYETRVYDGVPYTTVPNGVPVNGVPVDNVNADGERFFLAPFLVGGLAGTALGYGIANNNQINRPQYFPPMIYPTPYPIYTTNYYY